MTAQLAITFPAARARRDDGIARAVDHAETVKVGWQREAFERFRRYAERHEVFLTEDVLEANPDFTVPPQCDKRAWGAVARAAAKQGIVAKEGYAPAKTSNLSPKPLWRSRLFKAAA